MTVKSGDWIEVAGERGVVRSVRPHRKFESVCMDAVLASADSCSEPRADWPAACAQARRYLASVDLAAWVAA